MKKQGVFYKWWWGWEPEVLEAWLEKKEAQGWRLTRSNLGGIRFVFAKDKPHQVAYAADYQQAVKPEYYSLYQDIGWQLMYSWGGWYIWRMDYQQDKPRLYTDITSRQEMNSRLRNLLFSALAALLPSLVVTFNHVDLRAPLSVILYGVLLFFFAMDIYGIIKLGKVIQKLKPDQEL